MKRKVVAKTAAGVCAALGFVGFASAADAAVAPASAPTWHVVYSQATNSEFETVVATGKTSGFAFDEPNTTVAVPTAYERTGTSTFKKVPFPTVASEWIVGAGGTRSSDVYVFADILTVPAGKAESEVLKWTGKKFSVVATFSGELSGGTALSADDVYAYGGTDGTATASAGIYHYNGHKWTKISSAIGGNGDALSATSAYVADGMDLDHYNGHKWTATNLASLLPEKDSDDDPRLAGVLALAPDDIYAVGQGGKGLQESGPAVILHYNGHKWTKVASYPTGSVTAPVSDGEGGLWFSAGPELLHYSHGKLTAVAAPKFDGKRVEVASIAPIPGTSEELAGGASPAAVGPEAYHPPVILQYG